MKKLSRRSLLLAGLGLTASVACATRPASLVPPAPGIQPAATVPCDYPVIEMRGSAIERGRQYGKAAKDLIRRNIAFYSEVFQQYGKMQWAQAARLAGKFTDVIQRHSPESLEEMRGVAEGSGIPFADILTLNCRSEVMFASADACSCLAALARHCQGGHVLLGQTWDWFMPARENTCILRIEQPGKPSILMVAEAGLIGGKGVNSEGIGVCLNAVSVGKGKVGVPLHVMMRNVLNATLVTEAIEAVALVPRAGSGTFNIGAASDFAMSVEFSPDNFDVIMAEKEPVAHTNHYLSPLIAPFDTGKIWLASSFTRLNSLRRRIAEREGPLSPRKVFELLVAHENYPSSLCTHEDPRSGLKFRGCTIYAMVVDCTARKLWISNGYPCEGRVSEFSL